MAQPAIDIGITQEADGSLVVDLDVARRSRSPRRDDRHSANLVDDLGNDAISVIASELLLGIDADDLSRREWVDNYNEGLKLLGLLLENPSQISQNTSRVRNGTLAWAIVRFQALANGEMLPSGGPVKVSNQGRLPEAVADALERDLNFYMTVTAAEYYPDTDRALYYLAYGGTIFKKVYTCPVRRRPVSEAVYLPDLIISNEATSLANAARITHRVEMSRNDVLQRQASGWWADVPVPQPVSNPSTTALAQGQAIGIRPQSTRPEDTPHTIYECYTTLDLGRWGMAEKGQEEGIALPYRVTIDRDSRAVYEIRRNWREDDPLRLPRRRFVKWGMIPGIGYLDQGYLNLLGNDTMALTALERVLIDSGIYSIFPGGVRVKGMRMDTNEIRPAPGEFPEIDTNGMPINQAIMALPFKGPAAECLALLQFLVAEAEKKTGAVEVQTGEGTANIPVGTMMAAVEQQAQVMIAVHKRLHYAQKEEIALLREELLDSDRGLELLKQRDLDQPYTAEQLGAASLVPHSDPNVPAYVHRFLQATALETLASNHPEMYDLYEVQKYLLEIGRFPQPDRFLRRPQPQMAPPDPTAALAAMQERVEMAKLALKKEDQDGRRRLDEMRAQMEALFKAQELQADGAKAAADHAADQERAATDAEVRIAEAEADRVSRERIAAMNDQTKLILEGIRADAEPVSENPARDDRSGP